MKTFVSFICIFLFTFILGQYSVQTTNSPYNILIFLKEWVKKGEESKNNNLPPLVDKVIIIFDDSDISDADEVHKNAKNKCDNIINNGGSYSAFIPLNNGTKNSNALLTPKKEIHTEANTEGLELTSARKESNITFSNKFNNRSDETEISNMTCSEKNERYPIPGSCDRYIECQNGKAEEKQCPDGLRYNHNIKLNVYPCKYPADVQCNPGSTLQPPKPTDICPNQFGYFKTMDRFNCSSFRICENGIGYDYTCPDGLAFNTLTYRCEWPDSVPECNVEALLGYRCPEVADSKNLNVSRGYISPTDCRIYYTCINRKPRRLECDEYFAFDEINQKCVPAYIVAECSDKQKSLASRFIRRNLNGDYVIRDFDEDYLIDRSGAISFTPMVKKRLKTI